MTMLRLAPCPTCAGGERRPYVRTWKAGNPACWHAQAMCPVCGRAASECWIDGGLLGNAKKRAAQLAAETWNEKCAFYETHGRWIGREGRNG